MATKVHMEALSPTMEEGQIVKWVKSEGDQVSSGDILAEIETDKATMELVARGDGILRAVLLAEGDTAPVGAVIGVIASGEEDIDDIVASAGGSSSGDSAADESEDQTDGTPDGEGGRDDASSAAVSGSTESPKSKSDQDIEDSTPPAGRLKASPLARRLAEEAGIDLAAVSGSGPGGRIVKADVEEAASAPPIEVERSTVAQPAVESPRREERRPTPPPADWSDAGATEGHEDVKVSQMRKTIARRLTESLSPVPHFFLTIEVDMTRVMEARKSINAAVERDGDRVSVNDFVLRATASALRKHPACNAAWHEDVIRRFEHVHVGVAVAVDDGLITPVVRHADRKGLVQISREVKEMAGRAREKKLKPEEYTGSTFSISNLGMFGVREFTAIINPPEAGILAVGAVEEIPVAIDGEVVVRPRMRVTMSCDHRVVDGATGAKFLQTLRTMLEEPAAILI
jgi:pyruvate dehydrogenase E2 component (dihydrolipoamide acetyltransferase)